MVTSDQTHIDPAEYFSPDAPIPEQPILNKYFYPAFLPFTGFGMCCCANLLMRRPVFSSIHMHVLCGSGGLIGGFALERFVQKQAARRDAILYNYIITHPEDFAPVERIKYKDILERWHPYRC